MLVASMNPFFKNKLLYKQQGFKSSKLSNLKASKFEFKQCCGLSARYHLIQTFSIDIVQFIDLLYFNVIVSQYRIVHYSFTLPTCLLIADGRP